MKISIWQQFSSNHSGGFSVVGRFATEEDARKAFDTFTGIIRRIDEWHQKPEHQAWFERHLDSLTPVEENLVQEYEIEWGEPGGVDWYGDGHEPAIRAERDIFFHSNDTWGSSRPVAALLRKLGAQTYEDLNFGGLIWTIVVEVTSYFDSLETAQKVKENLIHIQEWVRSFSLKSHLSAEFHNLQYIEIEAVTTSETKLTIKLVQGITVLLLFVEWLRRQGGHDISYSFETIDHTG